MAGGGHEPLALWRGDAAGGAAVRLGPPRSNYHEHELCAVDGDQVDLAEAAAVVAREDLQSLGLEESGGETLGGLAAAVHGRSRTTSLPSLNCAARRRRANCRSLPSMSLPVTPSSPASALPASSINARR